MRLLVVKQVLSIIQGLQRQELLPRAEDAAHGRAAPQGRPPLLLLLLLLFISISIIIIVIRITSYKTTPTPSSQLFIFVPRSFLDK